MPDPSLPWRPPALAGHGPGTPARPAVAAPGPSVDPNETQWIDLVLVADDDEAARYVVRRQLEDLVGEVIEADAGDATLRALATRVPSAVVLDLVMPGLDGLEVLARMRAMPKLERTPVIIHTSKELTAHERSEIERLGAVVIAKGEASATRLLTTILERRA